MSKNTVLLIINLSLIVTALLIGIFGTDNGLVIVIIAVEMFVFAMTLGDLKDE